MNPIVRIVVPAHNEEARIVPTLEDYCAYFGARATVVVVANGCTDQTVGVVHALAARFANLRLIDIPGRVGKGGAIRAGLKTGDEPYIGFVDADHSTTAIEFDRLLERCARGGAAGVIGSRWMRGAIVKPCQPWRRRIASRVFNGLVRLLLGLPFQDTQCGAKIFTRSAVRAAVADLKLADFAFDIDLLYGVRKAGGRIIEEPTVWSDNATGTTVRLVGTSVRMFLSLLRLRLEHTPLSRLPFLQFLAADSIIPVYRPPAVLVLTDSSVEDSAPRKCLLETVAETLRGEGVLLRYPPGVADGSSRIARISYRVRTLVWYVFGSHRSYDAILEVASDVPFALPSISAKPVFILEDASIAPMVKSLYGLYSRAHRIEAQTPQADALVNRLRMVTLRIAAFEEHGDAWLLHFMPSGEMASRTIELR